MGHPTSSSLSNNYARHPMILRRNTGTVSSYSNANENHGADEAYSTLLSKVTTSVSGTNSLNWTTADWKLVPNRHPTLIGE